MEKQAKEIGKPKKSWPFALKLILPMMSILVLVTILLACIVLAGGMGSQLVEKTYEHYFDRIGNASHSLTAFAEKEWANTESTALRINGIVQNELQDNNATAQQLTANSELAKSTLELVFEQLLDDLKNRSADGMFVIFTGDSSPSANASVPMAGLYLSDADPYRNREDLSDLCLEWGPKGIVLTEQIKIASYSPSTSVFMTDGTHDDFIWEPMAVATDASAITRPGNFGFWSTDVARWGPDASLCYTIPLVMSGNQPYGVLGIVLNEDTIAAAIPASAVVERGDANYVLGLAKGNGQVFPIATRGVLSVTAVDAAGTLRLEKTNREDVYQLGGVQDEHIVASFSPVGLYEDSSPFGKQQFVLVYLVTQPALFTFSYSLINSFFSALAICLALGLLFAFIIGRIFTRPIIRLSNSIDTNSATTCIRLEQSGITEIDHLTHSIERLSQKVAAFSSKLSLITGMSSVPTAAFEYENDSPYVLFTGKLYSILGNDTDSSNQDKLYYLSKEEFKALFDSLTEEERPADTSEDVHLYSKKTNGSNIYIRIRTIDAYGQHIGTVEDVTRDILVDKRLEYERNYDRLTGLFNERAFRSKIQQLMLIPGYVHVGAMVMIDLDNLKYVNNQFGLKTGDDYIRCTADAIRRYMPSYSVITRMSGDEFYLFLYGFDSVEKAKQSIERLRNGLHLSTFRLPNGTLHRIRASVAVAWYPQDSTDVGTLIRYVDFTMQHLKSTKKGEMHEFDHTIYKNWSYLFDAKEELEKIIDVGKIDYAFQPIVDARDGSVFAYEALMRSQNRTLRTPKEILELARRQSKLYQIERITWFNALSAFAQQSDAVPCESKIFINSISSQFINEQDMTQFISIHGDYLSRIVVEMLEEEQQDDAVTKRKLGYIRKWNAQMALDDFGTGYNSEVLLLNLSPQYIKIDMSLVRGINSDTDRQMLVKNIIVYAKEHGIKIIAEGVETLEEMQTLIGMGVHYLQGFYLAAADFQLRTIPSERTEEIQRISANVPV